MKHTTQQLYGLSPHELKQLTYEEALLACRIGTRVRLRELMKPNFMDRDEHLISSVNKAAHWSESKLDELDNALSTPLELFFIHIKLAFKVLFKGAQ